MDMKRESVGLIGGGLIVIWFIALFAVGTGSAYGEVKEPDEIWSVPNMYNDYEHRDVFVYFVDVISFEMCPASYVKDMSVVRGCYYYDGVRDDVHIVKGKMFEWSYQGCTVRDHEWFHAMGYRHGEGPLGSTCPNPEWQWSDRPQWDGSIDKVHPDVRKMWEGYVHVPREMDPRMIKWY